MVATEGLPGPDPIDTYVGLRLREERRARALSQADLATAVGVTFQQVQKYERGTNRISASMLVRLAEHLGCPAGELLPPESPDEALEVAVHVMNIVATLPGAEELVKVFSRIASEAEREQLIRLASAIAERTK